MSIRHWFCYLGFTLTPTLSSTKHIKSIFCKALEVLGFIQRSSSEFKLVSLLKAFNCTLFHPIFQYGCIVWDHYKANASAMINCVEMRFLRFAGHKLNISHPPHNYTPVLHTLNLATLSHHRHMFNLSSFVQLYFCKRWFSFTLHP